MQQKAPLSYYWEVLSVVKLPEKTGAGVKSSVKIALSS
jgi:hypothetical protein